MNKEETIVLQLLTGKDHLDDVKVEQLQQLAVTYPYFAAAQLLAAKKMHRVKHLQQHEQIYKTALYFPDEQWFRYLLSETSYKQKDETVIAPVKTEENEIADKAEKTDEETTVLNPIVNQSDEENFTTQPQSDSASGTEDNNIITLPAETILEKIGTTDDISKEPEEPPLDEEELRQQTEPLPIEESNQKIATILSGQVEEFHKPVEDTTALHVNNEPFHTVDYFASQGIKLLDKEQQENNFDKKVHKFTDWLRQMKRINPHPADLGTHEEEETRVATIADSSNYTKEIVTESMANVLLMQGKKEKAVEIYQKLGLLYPHKNTYFAALIQQIK